MEDHEYTPSRKEQTKDLEERLLVYTGSGKLPMYMAREVTLDYGTNHPVRVDFVGFRPKGHAVSSIEKGDFYFYEIKSSVKDYRSPHGHNFEGDYNCYVMTKEVYEEVGQEVPWEIGILIPCESSLQLIKKAKKVERKRASTELLFTMLRSSIRDNT